MNQSIRGIGLLTFLLVASLLSSCRYGSFLEAGRACTSWQQERKGKIKVVFDSDGKKESKLKSLLSSGNFVHVRECIHAKGFGHFVGIELITPWKASMTKKEYDKIDVRVKKFWFN